ncbi:MAG: methyltransferase family protein [Candidatus Dormibacterales bacterium]
MVDYATAMRGEGVLGGAVPAPAAPRRERGWSGFAGRALPAAAFAVFVVDKLLLAEGGARQLAAAPRVGTAVYLADQLLGLAYFCLVTFLFVVRLPRRAGRRGAWVTAVSLFGTFALGATGFLPGATTRPELVALSAAMLTVGLAYAVYALSYLGRSFSILPEARRLVVGGPYGLTRHPLYLGEVVATVGFALPTIGLAGGALVLCALAALGLRIRWEEDVLAEEFPDQYPDYRRRVPMLLPLRWHKR